MEFLAMTRSGPTKSKVASVLADAAARLPGVTESIACAGTALESKTFVVAKKSFVFIGAKDARLKLRPGDAEATELAKTLDGAVRIGTSGWVTIQLHSAASPSASVLRRWVKESHGLIGSPSKPRH